MEAKEKDWIVNRQFSIGQIISILNLLFQLIY